jgi:hypothetical protein
VSYLPEVSEKEKILNVREVVKEFGFGWKKVDAMQHAISNFVNPSTIV